MFLHNYDLNLNLKSVDENEADRMEEAEGIQFEGEVMYDDESKMILFLLPLFYVKLGSIFTVSGLLFYKKNSLPEVLCVSILL